MRNVPSRIHGHEVPHFIEMLRSELRLDLDDKIWILGGMSNLNLLMNDGKKRYVVKVPALQLEYDENPYDMQWLIQEIVYRYNLSTRPVATGMLGNELPFLVTEYEKGVTKTNPHSFQDDELVRIRNAQCRFSRIRLPVPCYDHPRTYLRVKQKQLEQVSNNDESHSMLLRDFLDNMSDFGSELEEKMAGLPFWQSDTVHGDFRPSNVVLKAHSILLIDFENTFTGSSFYDSAYFFVEPKGDYKIPKDNPLVKTRENQEMILKLVPLALFSCLTWTLTRLLHLEMGIVEDNLVNTDTRARLTEYCRQKSVQLANILGISI